MNNLLEKDIQSKISAAFDTSKINDIFGSIVNGISTLQSDVQVMKANESQFEAFRLKFEKIEKELMQVRQVTVAIANAQAGGGQTAGTAGQTAYSPQNSKLQAISHCLN